VLRALVKLKTARGAARCAGEQYARVRGPLLLALLKLVTGKRKYTELPRRWSGRVGQAPFLPPAATGPALHVRSLMPK
jgi:hypothetical protein